MRKKKTCVVIPLDKYRKEKPSEDPERNKTNDKQTLFIFATSQIALDLTDKIDESNIDYVIGLLLEAAEDIGIVYNAPGVAARRMKYVMKTLVESRLNRAKEIREKVRKAYEYKTN